MSNANQISIYRLNTILSLFQAKRARYSVKEIAFLLDAPVAVVRKDFVNLHNNVECGITFYSNEIEEDEFEDMIADFESGKYDDVALMAQTTELSDVTLALTQMELACLDEFLDGNPYKSGKHVNYVTKPLYYQARANMQVKVEEMQNLIEDGASIRIHYKAKSGNILFLDIHPLRLVHNALDDLYYIVTVQNDEMVSYRLDKVRRFEVLEEEVPAGNPSVLDKLPQIWGMEIGEAEYVKIFIRDEGDVVRKVRRDLADRVNGVWTEVENGFIFEDEVIGINHFRNWLNSYGSSVLVMEPVSLRNYIIESAKQRLSKYE